MIVEYKPVLHLSKQEAEMITRINHSLSGLENGQITIKTEKGYSETFGIVVDE